MKAWKPYIACYTKSVLLSADSNSHKNNLVLQVIKFLESKLEIIRCDYNFILLSCAVGVRSVERDRVESWSSFELKWS